MKWKFGIKGLIISVFIAQGLILIIGYTLLTGHYFVLGMDNMMLTHMHRIASHFGKIPKNQLKLPQQHFEYTITNHWEELPPDIQERFNPNDIHPNTLYKSPEPEDNIRYLYLANDTEPNLFIAYSNPNIGQKLNVQGIQQNFQMLIYVFVFSALLLGLILLLFNSRISKNIHHLGMWANNLSPTTLNNAIPNFYYAELNTFAKLIQNSMHSVNDSIERERQLLRYMSHELRTPITTIRSCVSLISRLKNQDKFENLFPIVDRIDHASLTMKHITETLLWLHHKDIDQLPTQACQLNELIDHIVEELDYLIDHNRLKVMISTKPTSIKLPIAATHIVIGNFIRNAIQHTWSGEIRITQQDAIVEIINHRSTDHIQDELGFGLGLELTEKLCSRLHWDYNSVILDNGRRVTLTLLKAEVI